MTPMDSFLRELTISGYALSRIPGSYTSCGCDIFNKVIFIGNDIPSDEVGIVGLHELGHAKTVTPVVMFFLFNPIISYSYELSAWAWAEQHMPIGYETKFNEVRDVSLRTYYSTRMLDERFINSALLVRG